MGGLEMLEDSNEVAKLGAPWYLMEMLTVLVHMAFMFVPGFIVFMYAMAAQDLYGLTVGPITLQWLDMLAWEQDSGVTTTFLLFDVMVGESVAFVVCAFLRMIFHYCNPPQGVVRKIVVRSFATILVVHLWALFLYTGTVCSWFILAAVLEPTKFLPYGVGVIVVVYVAVTTHREMSQASMLLKKKVEKLMHITMQNNLKILRAEMEAEMMEKMANDLGLRHRNLIVNQNQEEELKPKVDEKDLTPADIFNLLNVNGDEFLDMEEFKNLFEKLDIPAPEGQIEQMFAFCDMDGSGTLTETEFVDGWEYLMEGILESAADGLGLSTIQIVAAVLTLMSYLAILFIFIFLALGGWYNEASFDSIVQSSLVAGSGKFVKTLRNRSKAENPDDVDGLVSAIMGNAEEKAESAG